MTPPASTSERRITEYELYLRVPELLSLQKPAAERTHVDELTFQVVHQVEELWMSIILDEGERAILNLNAANKGATAEVENACRCLERMVEIERLMTAQLRLIDTLTPYSYVAIRKGLGHGSGQESPGFNGILELAPRIDRACNDLLARAGITALDLHREPSRDPLLLRLLELMMDFDQFFQAFRYVHVIIVKRIIGAGTPSLKGKPTELLERSMRTQLFPTLWQVRETMFADFVAGSSLIR